MRLMLTLQYSGHEYGGWQHQPASGAPKLPSIQGTLCTALNALLGLPSPEHASLLPRDLMAAGRTDAGVHAYAQVVHADVPEIFAARAPHSWVEGLNHHLPKTLRVVAAQPVDEGFHARFSATGRAYVYRLWVGRQLRPDLLYHAGHLAAPYGTALDMAALQAALGTLPVGVPTDYTSLRDAECQSQSPICTLSHATLAQAEPNLWLLHIGADHFLHHMVRNLVGTLAQVALGKRQPNLMPLLLAKDRRLAGPTFSPDGLYLSAVSYPHPYTLPKEA